MYEAKVFGPVELKGDDGTGEFQATFSTFSVVDRDQDVVLPGAIKGEVAVVIGSYNHGSIKGTSLPVGVGVVHTDHRHAWVSAQFLDTPAGKAHYKTLKALGPLAEYSYGFDVKEASVLYRDLEPFPGAKRVLKSLDVIEVSPVIRGASLGTGTDWMKNLLAIDDETLELMRRYSSDPEVDAIWQHLEAERQRTSLVDLRFL